MQEFEEQYDIVTVTRWTPPEKNDARVLGMPNIPKPLHSLAPRTVLGKHVWDQMRRATYAKADYVCEACGERCDKGFMDAHELYDIDYEHANETFVRTIGLCRACHRLGIHTGRALTLYEKNSPLMSKDKLLFGAEHAFSTIAKWNKEHPDDEPIRVYSTWLSYLKNPTLADEMKDLIKKYDIKFYRVAKKWENGRHWADWRLTILGKQYEPIYKTAQDWEEHFDGSKDTDRNYKNNLAGGVYDELDKFLKENIDKA